MKRDITADDLHNDGPEHYCPQCQEPEITTKIERFICDSCGGVGWIDVGDCEEGVTETCPECNGIGEIL